MKKFVVLLCFITVGLTAQDKYVPSSAFVLNSAYNRFRYNETQVYLEVSIALYPGLLSLMHDKNGFSGTADVRLMIKSLEADTITAIDRIMVHVRIPDTTIANTITPFLSKTGYTLSKGSYLFSIMAIDSLTPRRKDSLGFKIEIETPKTETYISDLELSSSIQASENKEDVFYKNSYRVLDNPSMVFGAMNSPAAFVYSELYNLSPEAVYHQKLSVLDRNGKMIKEQTRTRKFGTRNTVDVLAINVSDIPSAPYRMHYALSDTMGKPIAHSERLFFAYNPGLEQKKGFSAGTRLAEFAGLSEEELNLEYRQIGYLLSKDDKKKYESLTSAEGHREYLAQLWNEIENGNRGTAPITRATYFQRIQLANDRFRVMGKEGWRTDRGRVFLLFGQPDEIEHFPSTGGNKPHEVWHYRSLENGVYFVFIDLRNFGDYILMHSTKRGEQQDEQWQQYLH
ncbi:MAG: GWxTD domain-containing protein [bacterium]